MMKKLKKNQNGFTLIEMIVVLFIVSLLMLLVVPGVAGKQKEAKTTGNEAFHSVLQSQVELYEAKAGKSPAGFSDLNEYLTEKQIAEANNQFQIVGGKVTKKTGQE